MQRTRKRLGFNATEELELLRRKRRRLLWRNALLVAVFLSLFVLSFDQVINYEHDVMRTTFTIEGQIPVPVLEMRPAQRETGVVAIIAHGTFGSKELMTGFGVQLAHADITAYLFDFPGYGESPRTLADATFSPRTEQDNIATVGEVVDYARSHNSTFLHPRLLLIGYTLGAAAITSYSITHSHDSDIISTILLSPLGQEMPTRTEPKNLLILVGQSGAPEIIANSKRLLQSGCGKTAIQATSVECGSWAKGTGRRFVILPILNDVTILSASSTFYEVLSWLQRNYLQYIDVNHRFIEIRSAWVLLGIVAILLSMFPLQALLIDILDIRSLPRLLRGWEALFYTLCLLAGIAAAIAILYIWMPFSFVHVLLADYVSGYFFLTATVAALLIFLIRRMLPIPLFHQTFKQLLLVILLAVFLYFTLGQLMSFAWQRFTLTLPRLWRCGLIFVLLWPLFLLDEGINRGYQEQHALFALLSSLGFKALIIVGLVVATSITPGMRLFGGLLPALGVFLFFFVIFCWQLYRNGRAGVASATLSALLLAWAMSTTFPIT